MRMGSLATLALLPLIWSSTRIATAQDRIRPTMDEYLEAGFVELAPEYEFANGRSRWRLPELEQAMEGDLPILLYVTRVASYDPTVERTPQPSGIYREITTFELRNLHDSFMDSANGFALLVLDLDACDLPKTVLDRLGIRRAPQVILLDCRGRTLFSTPRYDLGRGVLVARMQDALEWHEDLQSREE